MATYICYSCHVEFTLTFKPTLAFDPTRALEPISCPLCASSDDIYRTN